MLKTLGQSVVKLVHQLSIVTKTSLIAFNDLLKHNLLHESLQVLHYHHESFIYLIKYVHNEMRYVPKKCTYMQDMKNQIQCNWIRV